MKQCCLQAVTLLQNISDYKYYLRILGDFTTWPTFCVVLLRQQRSRLSTFSVVFLLSVFSTGGVYYSVQCSWISVHWADFTLSDSALTKDHATFTQRMLLKTALFFLPSLSDNFSNSNYSGRGTGVDGGDNRGKSRRMGEAKANPLTLFLLNSLTDISKSCAFVMPIPQKIRYFRNTCSKRSICQTASIGNFNYGHFKYF